MPINPITGEEEEVDVKDYLMKKLNLGPYSQENRKQLVDDSMESDFGTKIRAALGAAGAGFSGGNAMAAGNSILDRDRQQKTAKIDAFDKERGNAIQDYSLQRDVGKNNREDEIRLRKQNPDSEESKMAREIAKQFSPGMSFDGYSAEKLESVLPSIQKLAQLKSEAANRSFDNQMKREQIDATREQRDLKRNELGSTEAKQLGLYNIGSRAEDQYNKAVSDKSEYDPTEVGQWIDNSQWAPNFLKNDKAIESQAAQANWIESFLRDASGAAIPRDERMAYAKDFFPQPGDTDDVIQNKAAMRAQKMENARLAAGPAGRKLPPVNFGGADAESMERQKRIAELKAKKSRIGGL